MRGIGRQQIRAFAVETHALEGDFIATAQGKNIALAGLLLTANQRDIAIGDRIARHAVAADTNCSDVATAEKIRAQREAFTGFVEHRQWRAGGNLRDQIEAGSGICSILGQQVFRYALRSLENITLFFQRLQMKPRRGMLKPEMAGDFAQ